MSEIAKQVIEEWLEKYYQTNRDAITNRDEYESKQASDRVVFLKMLRKEITKRENAGVCDE